MKASRSRRERMAATSCPRNRIAPPRRRNEAEDHARQRRLAAAGFADDGEDLRPVRRQREAHRRPPRRNARRRGASRAGSSASPPRCRAAPLMQLRPASRRSTRRGARRDPRHLGRRAARHTSIASGQRGWKRQPGGGSARLGGRPSSAARGAVSPMRGRLPIRCSRVGMARRAEQRRGRTLLDDAAGIHHRRAGRRASRAR